MKIREIIKKDIYNLLKDEIEMENILIEKPKIREMGDYAIPCFSFSKELRRSPTAIAKMLNEKLTNSLYEKTEVVNGYLNIFINKKIVLEYVINEIITNKKPYLP